MTFRPSGTAALLVELESREEVLDHYASLLEQPPRGVVDVVPAMHTILLVIDPTVTTVPEVERAVGALVPGRRDEAGGGLVELPVTYDGADLSEVASLLGCGVDEVVRRHTATEWTVAFCGFAPGFGYLTAAEGAWDIPRRDTPRTRVPRGSVALAGEFSGVYPRESPGGWQLLGRTEVPVFDLSRDPAALLTPGTRVRFVEEGR
jgi:KipI family sensor histidine kinase inhibitor